MQPDEMDLEGLATLDIRQPYDAIKCRTVHLSLASISSYTIWPRARLS